MVINYTHFNLINFPIYALPSDDIHTQDGLLYCESGIVDDRNQIGDTLGARRLQTFHRILPLQKIHKDLTDLISSKHRVFVDYKGYCFIYERTKFCKVKFHKIVSVIKKDVGTILKVSGVRAPVVVKRPPPDGMDWVGLLYVNNNPWIPYEYSFKNCAPFRKKI